MAKVLLVEDDNNLREIYQARLTAEGYDIIAAQNGEEALVVAKQNKPDLIISDVMMPRISGFEMLDILRNTEQLKSTKVIMLTALGQAEDQKRADTLGADKYLVKSQVTLEDIVNAAKELLGEGDASDAITAVPPAPEPAQTPQPAAATPAPAPVNAAPQVTPVAPEPVAAAQPMQPAQAVTPPAPTPMPEPAVAAPTSVADPSPITPQTPAVSSVVTEPASMPTPTVITPTQTEAPTTDVTNPPVAAAPAPSTTPEPATPTAEPVAAPMPAPAPVAEPSVVTPTPVAVPVAPEPVAAEPAQPVMSMPAPDASAATDNAQTLAAEEAALQAQISNYAEAAPEPALAVEPTPEPATPTAEPVAAPMPAPAPVAEPSVVTPTPEPANNAAANDAAIAQAVQALNSPAPAPAIQPPSVANASAAAPMPAPEPVTPPAPAEATPLQGSVVPTPGSITAAPMPSGGVAGKKIIQPISDPVAKPSLDELLAKEESKAAPAAGTPVVNGTEAATQPAAAHAPGESFDPNTAL